MEENKDNSGFKYKGDANASSQSRFKKDGGMSFLLWAVLVVLAVLIIIEVAVLVKNGKENSNTPENTDSVPTFSATDFISPSPAASGATVENSPSSAPTEIPTTAPTSTPSGETPNGSTDLKEAKILDPYSIDFSFLDGISKEPFEDGSPLEDGSRSYDWYPGKVIRAADGTISKPWDRYSSTLNYLKKYNGIYRKDETQNNIYLTFDCGYEYGYTTKILDTLKEKNVKAIFFVTGGFLDDPNNHALLKRMYDEGHLIGNHTDNHKIMPTLSNEEFVKELNSVYSDCKKILGDSFTMSYYRPPQGASCPRDLALSQYLGYNSTFWSFAYGDYNVDNQPDHTEALNKMKEWLHPGAVYLLHAVSSTNTAVLWRLYRLRKGGGLHG